MVFAATVTYFVDRLRVAQSVPIESPNERLSGVDARLLVEGTQRLIVTRIVENWTLSRCICGVVRFTTIIRSVRCTETSLENELTEDKKLHTFQCI